ncbi:MAG: hypothetical protein M1828_002610 [Chrysothrix sp. TS-e1954]|nr:MAG: hypothetical protein M1828_002610 [Chrysothrix sp. TS-e1954]
MDPNQQPYGSQQPPAATQQQAEQNQPYFPPPPNAAPPVDSSHLQHPPPPVAGSSSSGTTQQQYPPPPPASGAPSSGAQPYYPPPPSGAPPSSSATQQPYFPPPPGSEAGPNTQQPAAASYNPAAFEHENPPPLPGRPPQKTGNEYADDDVSNPTNYIRDPHKLVAYLVPFPIPTLKSTELKPPPRFLIYTPPPPPIAAPAEGQKEGRITQVQRKWQNEVRTAKTSDAKVTSWKGVKGRVTKGVDWAMSQTKSSNLEFVNRIPGAKAVTGHDSHADDGHEEGETTHKTVGLEEMVLIYPATLPGSQEELRQEFVDSMLRTKSKAQKDAVIATGLIPVTFAIDILATFIWPFGGLGEIDTVWAAASLRGAKTSRSVTKRLNSTGTSEKDQKLQLTFTPSPRLDVLTSYLSSECHRRDAHLFRGGGVAPTERQAVEAIGWSPSQTGGETRNWEDEQWELQEVKDDLKQVMHKGAREWDKWCKAFEKDPKKALKT